LLGGPAAFCASDNATSTFIIITIIIIITLLVLHAGCFHACAGNDVSRSMLVFAKGKPLGRDGLDWLKIHLVNLTGFKKRSPAFSRSIVSCAEFFS